MNEAASDRALQPRSSPFCYRKVWGGAVSCFFCLAVAGHVKNPVDDCARGDRERTRNVVEVDA